MVILCRCLSDIHFEEFSNPHNEMSQDSSATYVMVHYVKVIMPTKDSVLLRRDVITLVGSNDDCCAISHDVAKLLQDNECHRPKSLLVFINPASGWKDGVKNYRNVVSPILTLCNVERDVIETENADHAAIVLCEYDLSSISGIVTIGGDGSLNQLVKGLLERTCKDMGIDISSEDASMVKPSLPIGLIPCGTTNAVSFHANGAKDIETCVLNIILGRTTVSDFLVVRNRGEFVAHSNILQQFGLAANIFLYIEPLRWLSKLRYNLFPFLAWWLMRDLKVEIEFLPVTDDMEFRLDPSVVREVTASDDFTDGPRPGWKTYKGSMLGMYVLPWPLHDFMKNTVRPTYSKPTFTSSGKFLLAIDRLQSFGQCMKSISKMLLEGRVYIPSDSVLQVEVKECTIKALNSWSDPSFGDYMGNDGEILYLKNGQHVEVSVRKRVLKYFSIDDDLICEARKFIS